jgi:ADP-ribosyltransferase exoenzyme
VAKRTVPRPPPEAEKFTWDSFPPEVEQPAPKPKPKPKPTPTRKALSVPYRTRLLAWQREWDRRDLGGPGSGHHGHAGIPGQRGGSAPAEGGAAGAGGWPVSDETVRTIDQPAVTALANQYEPWVKTLSDDDREAIRTYVEDGYLDINAALRAGRPSAEAARLTEVLARAPAPPPGTVVWRGVGAGPGTGALQALRPGDEVQLKGFQSATADPAFAERVSPGAQLLFEIRPTKGAYVRSVSLRGDEYEYLMPHGATYRVRGVTAVPFASGKRGTVVQLEMQ